MPDRRILLIEDEPDIAELISLHLGGNGTAIRHASDGVDGLALALAEPWDLLLLDLSLPRCDGLAICEGSAATRCSHSDRDRHGAWLRG